jgi:hypothetical protein
MPSGVRPLSPRKTRTTRELRPRPVPSIPIGRRLLIVGPHPFLGSLRALKRGLQRVRLFTTKTVAESSNRGSGVWGSNGHMLPQTLVLFENPAVLNAAGGDPRRGVVRQIRIGDQTIKAGPSWRDRGPSRQIARSSSFPRRFPGRPTPAARLSLPPSHFIFLPEKGGKNGFLGIPCGS